MAGGTLETRAVLPRLVDPGRLDRRLTLEAGAETPDGQGGATVSFTAIGTLWGRIDTLPARFEERAGGEIGTARCEVLVRARADLRTGMRFTLDGVTLAIRSVRDPDGSGRYRLCLCEAQGDGEALP